MITSSISFSLVRATEKDNIVYLKLERCLTVFHAAHVVKMKKCVVDVKMKG